MFMLKMGRSWGQVAILRRLGAILEAILRPRWGQDGAKLGQVGPKLGSSCDLEASWEQLGGNLAEDGQEDQLKLT